MIPLYRNRPPAYRGLRPRGEVALTDFGLLIWDVGC